MATEGPTLAVYDLNGPSKTLIHSEVLFPECFKITDLHITKNGRHIIVHTEKSLKVLSAESYKTVIEFMKESVDKIIHSTLVEGNTLVVINAHNFVEVWDMGQDFPVRT